MRHHYHTIEDITLRPAILGLTASPIVRSKPQELQTLETNLDAVARTPAVHREELEAHVTTPELVPVIYPACPEPTDPNVAKSAITWVVLVSQAVDFHEDPYIKVLLKRSLHDSAAQRSYIKLLKTENTYCQVQFNTFERKAIHLWEELGDWAVQVLVDNARTSVMRKEEAGFAALGMEEDSEKAYLKEHVLRIANGALHAPIDSTLSSLQVEQFSPKLQKLMHLLEQAWTPEFSGLVFVERRITASALSLLLNQHPSTRSRFRSGYAVGESSDPRRRTELGDLTETGQLTATLSAFRAGTKNLLICTNALEEGIDVPACRYVICYDRPANLKSFIQKRGRARARVSTFAIFAPEGESWGLVDGWKDLEREMVKLYQDEGRVVGERSGEDEEREAGYPPLRVEATR